MRFTIRNIVWSGSPGIESGLREAIYGRGVGQIFLENAQYHGFEIQEVKVVPDHVHVFLSFPPKYSTAQVIGMRKSISASVVFENFPEVKKQSKTTLY